MADVWIQLLAGWLLMAAVMSVLYGMSRKNENAGIVDIGWAFGFCLMALLHLVLSRDNSLRGWLCCGMLFIANFRLGLHLLKRYLSERPIEEPRYHQLREAWGDKSDFYFFFLFQSQALLVALLTYPIAVATQNNAPHIALIEWIALGVWLSGFVGEAVADQQLKLFKSNPANKGKTCTLGLWNYSRHPNYFFEWTLWLSYFLFALGTTDGAWSIFVPVIMLVFLTKVTGIAATEAHALTTRSDYADYQKSTSAFIPWVKRPV